MTAVNATTSAMDALAMIPSSSLGWVVTTGVFIAIFIMLFLLSKNIRQFMYGSVVSIILIIAYKISRWIGLSTASGDNVPISWFFYIIGFIILSIIIGMILMKLKWFKDLEMKL